MLMKFIGKDSLGYVNGKIYNVEIQSEDGYIYLYCQNHVCCPYGSLKALMKNWIEVRDKQYCGKPSHTSLDGSSISAVDFSKNIYYNIYIEK